MDNIALRPIPEDRFSEFTRQELIVLLRGEQQIRLQREAQKRDLEEEVLRIEEKYVTIKSKFFGKSSEKSVPLHLSETPDKKNRKKKITKTVRLPSERYPNIPVLEKEVELSELPACRCCQGEMLASPMYDVSEYLTVIPKQYIIIRQKRRKYRCGSCHGDIQTAPTLPRIKPASAYSDEMIIDAALSKYCDLIPIERYCAIAARQGIKDLPANSLVEATHNLADFLSPAVEKIRGEVLSLLVLMADETPHRMLEGDAKSNWFLWGFSGDKACYFECHDTRSGDVASKFLAESHCEVLVSDVYSGYAKAVRETNQMRTVRGIKPIESAYCNAHARRKFKEAELHYSEESKFFLEKYRQIYYLESEMRGGELSTISFAREEMRPIFDDMQLKAQDLLEATSTKSSLSRAINYFLKNIKELTKFLTNHAIPIDNNAQERNLRNPVIGRKTWYGTHSLRGAETSAKLFTLVESCKINNVNPREYFQALVTTLHAKQPAFTPNEFKLRCSSDGE